MRRDWLTILYSLIFLLILGAGIVFLPASASTISAKVDIDPDKINLSDSPSSWDSPWVAAFIQFPKPYSKSLSNINVSTILFDGVVPASKGELITRAGGWWFKAYFDRQAVEDYLWLKTYHMGLIAPFKNKPVTLTVTGSLYDGTSFTGSDTILVSAR